MTAQNSMRFGPEWMRQGPHNNVVEEGLTAIRGVQNKEQDEKEHQEQISYLFSPSLSQQPNNTPESPSTTSPGLLRYSKEFLLSIWKDMFMSEKGISKPSELNQFSQISSDEVIAPVSLSEMSEEEKKLFIGPVNSEKKRRNVELMNNIIYGNSHFYANRAYSPRNERFINSSRFDQKTRSKEGYEGFRNPRMQKSREYFPNTFPSEIWTPGLRTNTETLVNNMLSNGNNEVVPSSIKSEESELRNAYTKENRNISLSKGIADLSISQINTPFLSSDSMRSPVESIGSIPGRNISRLQSLGMFESQNSSKISPTSTSPFQYDDSDDVLKEAMEHISEDKDKSLENFQNKLNTNLDINKSLENMQKEKTQFLGLFSPSDSPSLNKNSKIEKLFENPQQSNFSQPSPLQPPSRTPVMPDKLNWLYKDPMGITQGPFSSLKMQDWYNAGFFQLTLLVKQVNDEDFEPLSSLIARVGNQKEPFLAPFYTKLQAISPVDNFYDTVNDWDSPGLESKLDHHLSGTTALGNINPVTPTSPGWNRQTQFPKSFSFESNLAPDQHNSLESRKHEEYLMHHKKNLFQQQRLTQLAIQQQKLQNIQKQTQNQQERPMQVNFLRKNETFPLKLTKSTTSEPIVRSKPLDELNIPRIDEETPEFSPHFNKTVEEKLSNLDPMLSFVNTEQNDLLNFTRSSSEIIFSKPETIQFTNSNNIQKQPFQKKNGMYLKSSNTNQILNQPLIKQKESQKTPIHPISPWANVLDDIKDVSLREAQGSEVKDSQNSTQDIFLNCEYSKKVNSTKKEAHPIINSLPETSAWRLPNSISENSSGSMPSHNLGPAWQSPGIIVKKSLAEIQEEEQKVKVNKYQKQLTINTMAASLSSKNHTTLLKKPSQSPWITVGPDGRSVSRSSPVTLSSRTNIEASRIKTENLDLNQKKSNVSKFYSTQPINQSSNSTNSNISGNSTKSNSNDFFNWCKKSLKALNPGINLEDFLQMLMSLPVEPSQETIEIISDSIYANSAILDGRRFAEEFVKRRLENISSDNETLEKNIGVQSWTDALKSQKQKESEWNSTFKIVSNKKNKKRN
ncbi:hypothetical protein T552_02194 [Pneumocystis carinii B80]|uniref:GYF domain-containing protein n=1 Tax=Pneumocystis carinii (strain B80) TaxID=1408658 RepID=A0A0W4ZHA1_PNEC8|nr:hypothetical protein T552_02194 [Pneumocystis carinii B80]KTW27754.1 hypothetical protein T552_02194 [Pneumocystis carinii B80]